ncbi:hypothetical protein BCR44DRAFT_1431212 [Catenaria anguillulae PL171]|uniref:Uncharacterized protein n=1 Tax=Catenaria anguillulae PL171 TaxID=765915 RepID=A0A1Y2HT55_9FUNG|nr:hypothetical protein BCR44DRAFT_1431212 [Catenaria anguillulae PL171]
MCFSMERVLTHISVPKSPAHLRLTIMCKHPAILSELSPMSTPLDNSSIHTQEYTPNAQRLAKLLDHLNTRHAITPVEFFIRFARSWDWNQVKSFIHAQLNSFAEWLNWSMPDKPTALRQMKVLAHLLDMAIAQDAAVTKTRLAQVNRTRLTVMVAACACHLGMHARSKSSNAQQDDAAPIPSAATRAVLIDTWVDMTSSAYGTHRYLPAHLQEHTCALVRRAAAEAEVVADEPVEGDPSELARRIAQGETDLGRALALYIAFDKEYVAEQLRWSGSTPLWVWRQFTAEHSEYRIHYPKTVTDALRHGARVGTTEDVQAIVRHVPLEWWAGSREWLSMLRDFVERKPGSDLREVLSTLESGH